jgi:hypothetical protein
LKFHALTSVFKIGVTGNLTGNNKVNFLVKTKKSNLQGKRCVTIEMPKTYSKYNINDDIASKEKIYRTGIMYEKVA